MANKNNRLVLFRNTKKRKNSKDPDYKGEGVANGREVWTAAWVQESKRGEKYLSIALTPKEGQRKEGDLPF